MINRLRIAQRLTLLLLLPLAGVVVTSAPFVVTRVDESRAVRAVQRAAAQTGQISALVQGLQQERLLALGHLVSPTVDQRALLVAQAAVDDTAAGLTTITGTPSADLRTAVQLRPLVLNRTADAERVLAAYGQAITSLIDSLGLAGRPGLDAGGVRRMAALDDLLRADEEDAEIGAALVLAAKNPTTATGVASAGIIRERLYADRFRRQADPAYVALFDTVRNGQNVRRAVDLVRQLLAGAQPSAIGVTLSAAQAGIDLRRTVQDQIIQDLSARADADVAAARISAIVGGGLAVALLIAIIWLGTLVGWSVSIPLQRLTMAAATVADIASRELIRVGDAEAPDESPPRLAAVNLRTDDELGDLASAFNRVQATAALLMEQQVTTRRNVSIMFANIAYRTRGLVARQLAGIDELERDERDDARLAKLYQLDHLTTRLRRSAASLLVIAGSREEQAVATAPMADVIRSAVAEIEGYRAVAIAVITRVSVSAALVSDLTLLLAELLENATAFSPPDTPVEISAEYTGDCVVRVVDRGIGMPVPRLVEENRRLGERERLDVAPTAMLGLFVVGRIARRHGLSVELLPTAGGGLTAQVRIPAALLVAEDQLRSTLQPTALPPSAPAPVVHHTLMPHLLADQTTPVDSVGGAGRTTESVQERRWVGRAAVLMDADADVTRSGLRRRVRGESAPVNGAHRLEREPLERDADAERSRLDDFERGFARATREPAPSHGLVRRTPGRHLAEELRHEPAPTRTVVRPADGRARDADAERWALSDYSAGLARAAVHLPDQNRSGR